MGSTQTFTMAQRTFGSLLVCLLACAYFSQTTLATDTEVEDFEFADAEKDSRIVKRAAALATDDEDFLMDEPGSSGFGGYEGSGTEETTPTVVMTTTSKPTVDPNYPRFYRVTFNITSLAYAPELGDRNSQAFEVLSSILQKQLEDLFKDHTGEQLVTILSFSKGSLMVTFDLGSQGGLGQEELMKILEDALKKGMLGKNRVSLEGFDFRPLDAEVSCPEFVGRKPDALPTTGRNYANLLVNNAFPCEGIVTAWEYYRLVPFGSAFVSVWRQRADSDFALVKKTELPSASVGVTTVQLPDPISVQQGDFIGIFYPRSTTTNIIAQAREEDNAVLASELYQNYETELYDDQIRVDETLNLNNVRFNIINTTFAIRAVMDYDISGQGPDGGNEYTCKTGEFSCRDGYCIQAEYQCDQQRDCLNGADEEGCPDSTPAPEPCLEGRFRCDDGTCISRRLRCDGSNDCPDASDEFRCSECNADEFTCDSGQCIPQFVRCNGENNCADGSDEEDCPKEACKIDEFQCKDGTCIQGSLECDSRSDCPDGSDEFDCSMACKPDDFVCNDGTCIDASSKCDAFPDCPDNSDENPALCESTIPTVPPACPDGFFRCTSGSCIEKKMQCDGKLDCFDGSDERECEPMKCESNEFRCDDGTCIAGNRKCDNIPDCPDLSDEVDCDLKISGPREVNRGSRFQISCRTPSVRGVALSVQWLRNGTRMFENQRRFYRINTYKRRQDINILSELDIFRSDFNDSGTFTCRVSPGRTASHFVSVVQKACGRSQFTCRTSGRCVDIQRRCDGRVDCRDRSDEQSCTTYVDPLHINIELFQVCKRGEFRCRLGPCINIRKRCDRRRDCMDGSDEVACPTSMFATSHLLVTCSPDQFTCKSGQCILSSRRCDDIPDCGFFDLSDEEGCPCKSDQFECGNGLCISTSRKCNRVRDCLDGSDEEDCGCTANEFTCVDGGCVSSSLVCDRKADCQDGSDETDCARCRRNEFECADGTCVDISFRCNRVVQCSDGSDEAECNCTRSELACGNGQCIASSAYCNGQRDCHDGSDEDLCDPKSTCSTQEFTCDDGECIDRRRHCDGKRDCDDSSDEKDCTTTVRLCPDNMFQCDTGHCLALSRKCDGRRDCPNGSDERDCPTCSPLEFTCANTGQCIPIAQRCDDRPDCGDRSDERGCPCKDDEFTCKSDGRCLPPGYRCNGNPDCRDESDEEKCDESCAETEFQCGNGKCIDESAKCDNKYDCADGSDERDCAPVVTLTIDPEQLRVRDGRNAVFVCSGFDSAISRVGWIRRTGGAMPTKAIDDGSGRLVIPRCNSEDAGEYTCRLVLGDTIVEATSRLSVDVVQYQVSLSVTPQQLRVRAGRDALFVCTVSDGPGVTIEWVRRSGGAMPLQAVQDAGRLSFSNARPEDAGDYTCRVKVGDRYVEAVGRLGVDYIGPVTSRPQPDGPCGREQSTCSNDQCIPRDFVCDGENDCTDGSDEKECSTALPCEPNEFRCNNGRCALKIWRCDGDDDCFDRSDEVDCPTRVPGSVCRPDEFSCRAGDQCIPYSYQCDGEFDCQDNSDEIGCAEPSIVTPPQSEITVDVNGTFTIICEAVGIPMPLIVWRLNWGNIPTGPRVTVINENGRGKLQITNALNSDAGAYTCEAINNRGSIFAIPDALIIVRGTKQCKAPFFNAEAKTRDECVRCFCFGRTQTCYSSTLQMSQITLGNTVELVRRTTLEPTERGFVQYIPASREFEVRDFNRVLRTGSYYWSLPYQYLSKRLSSYGGTLNYEVFYDVDGFDVPTDDPDVILIGNGITLFHRRDASFKPRTPTVVAVPLVESAWERSRDNRLDSTSISDYASRDDLMLVLDNVTSILIRATYDNKQSFIKLGNVLLTTGVVETTGLGRAVTVEECSCPTGYTGLSCEECDSGFYGVRRGRFNRECTACNCNGHSNDCDSLTGVCRVCRDNTAGPYCNECAPGYFGDPMSGRPNACQPCPCPLTSPDNQFSSTCRLDADGQVTCMSCPDGYIGRRCERCDRGYIGDPTVAGDYCKLREETNMCDTRGSLSTNPPPGREQCECKANVQGVLCDECRSSKFFLSESNPDGCVSCFCTGVTQTCQSSTYNRSQIVLAFSESAAGMYLVDPAHRDRYEDNLNVDRSTRELVFRGFEAVADSMLYWALPSQYLGDKVSSYGGKLRFTLRYTPGQDNSPVNTRDPLVEISGNDINLVYRSRVDMRPNTQQSFSIPFIETEWVRMSGERATRAHLLMALADLDFINIRAGFTVDTVEAAISSISLDIAENRNTGQERAYAVEQCSCPRGYKGLSCEDCATGYTRNGGGLYLGLCQLCQCNGHSSTCDPETGVCRNCRHNTAGDNCEKCARGFYGDASRGSVSDCQPCPCPLTRAPNQFSPECFLDKDSEVTCSSCPAGHEGRKCERCAAGYQGNPMTANDYCKLINVTCDCDVRGTVPNTLCESDTQKCQCKTNTQGMRCSSCQDGYFHLTRENQQGCLKCFCSGVTNQCSSSNFYRQEITPMLNSDGTHNFALTNRRLSRTISDGFTMNAEENEITFGSFEGIQRERESLYIQLPPKFRGDKVTSYGGYLRFSISYANAFDTGRNYQDVDVEIISKQDKRMYYLFRPSPRPSQSYSYDVHLVESSFRNVMDGAVPSREDFMYVLSDIDAILIRATYHTVMGSFTLQDVRMDIAVPGPNPQSSAPEVESCSCPEGYAGLSCQECAGGYLKVEATSGEGPRCIKCNCNGHATSCDPNTGECLNCQHNTGGSRCESCARGYYGDPTAGTPNDCRACACPLNIPSNQFSPTCSLGNDNRVTCDRCPSGYSGRDCGVCAEGYRGNPRTPGGRCEPDDGPRPTVIVTPSAVDEPLGSTATFQCTPQGRGPFNVVWSRLDGRPLPRKSSSGLGPNYLLTITKLEYSDSARYVCTVTSARGTSQDYVTLTVRAPETRLRVKIVEPTTLVLQPGQPGRFMCIAVQYSSAANYVLSWSKNGGQLPPKATDQYGVLVIPDINESDLGTYRCIGSDPISNDTATATIRFGDLSKPPTVRIDPRYWETKVGDRVEFQCIAEGNPKPTITWTKGRDKPLPSYVVTDDNGLLRIESVSMADQAEYYCSATNEEGTTSVRTIIYVKAIERRIEVIVRRAVIEAVIGGTEQVTCYTRPSGAATLVWTREGGLPIGATQDNGVLTLSNIQPSYAGLYICTATGGTGRKLGTTTSTINVIGERVVAPTVRIEPERQTVSSGTTGTLRCIVTGKPVPEITWSRSGGELTSNHQVNGAVLRIVQASMADRDMYICTAENRGRRVQSSAIVDIERREHPRIELYPDVQQMKVAGNNAMFQCRVTRGIPAPTITWTRAGRKQFTDKTEVKTENGMLMFSSLTIAEQGEYICTATNVVGTITATASLRVEGPPVIEITPDSRITSIVGERVNVECVGIGNPTPHVFWHSDKRRRSDVLPEVSYSTESKPTARLTFNAISKSDAGRYICIAASQRGKAEQAVDIIVNDANTTDVTPNAHIEGPDRLSVILGQSVTLTCSANGVPNARIRWRRPGGLALPPNHSVRNGILYIPKLEEEYTGEYICSVSSDIVPNVFTASIYIIVKVTPRLTISPSNLVIRANQTITLRCQPTGQGPFNIEWTRIDAAMSPKAREGDGVLEIRQATRADSGQYRCIVRNSAGVSDGYATVNVIAPPSVNVVPKDRSVEFGSTIALECQIQGGADPQSVVIRWEKDGGELPPQHQMRNGILTLYNVREEDTGRYMCTASNEAGHDRDFAYLRVKPVGGIVLPGIPVRSFEVGDRVEFECVVKDAFQPTMTWIKKEGPLPASAIIGGNLLIIPEAREEDSGTYQCTATNEAGSVQSEVKLLVQGRPKISFNQEYTTASLGSPAQLRCEASGSPQPSISWVKEEGDLPDEHEIKDGGDLFIPRVREEDAGKYNCLASNVYGVSRYPVVLVVGSLVPYFQQNPTSYMAFAPLNEAYLDTDIRMSFRPETTDGLILYNGQYDTGSGDFLCFGLHEAYPEFRFDVGAGSAVIRGSKPLELNKWHTIHLKRNRKNGTMTVNDEPIYSGIAPGNFQGLDLAMPLYVGSVPDFATIPRSASFNTGFVGGISQVHLQGQNLNLGKDAQQIVGVESYPVCKDAGCMNGAICQPANNVMGFVCNCQQGFAGEKCELQGEKCYPGACGPQGRCYDLPTGQGFACICPIGFSGEGCVLGLTIIDPAFNKTSFISYPTITDGLQSVRIRLMFKPRSLEDSVILYNAQRVDGKQDFIALIVKDRHLEFRFDTGSGPAILRSRNPLRVNEWTMVNADRKGRDGMLIMDNEEAVNELSAPNGNNLFSEPARGDVNRRGSTAGEGTVGLNLERPLFLGGIDPEETLNSNTGASQGFVGCIGELTINDKNIDLIEYAIESVNIQDCGDRSLCARKPCQNRGWCTDVSPTEYKCDCPQQFLGDNCEIKVNICVTSQPCENGGNCLVTDSGSFQCQCPLGFMGTKCETAIELGTSVEFMQDSYAEFKRNTLTHRRRQSTERIKMMVSTLEDGAALLFWQGQKPGQQAGKDYLAIALNDGYVEFRYELGSGPAVIRSQSRINDGFSHSIVAERLGRSGSVMVDNQPRVNGTSSGPLQVLNVQGNIFFGGVPDLSRYTGSLFTKNFEGCISDIQILDKPALNFKTDPIGGMNVQPCLYSRKK